MVVYMVVYTVKLNTMELQKLITALKHEIALLESDNQDADQHRLLNDRLLYIYNDS